MFLKRVEIKVKDREIPYGIPSGMIINDSEDVYRAFRFLSDRIQEEFYGVYLDSKLRVLGVYQVAKGGLNICYLAPADVLRPALLIGAPGIITVHNHPTGDPEPSDDDRRMGLRLKEATLLMGLTLHDNLVISKVGYRKF